MLADVPPLSAADLRADLSELYRKRRHHHLFAYYGTGVEEVLQLDDGTGVQQLAVVPVRSEIELRERMPPLEQDDGVQIAFLVPFTHDIPIDLAGRFALNGRVRKIGKEARLMALFGVTSVDDDACRSPLCEYLLRPGAPALDFASGDARLTLDALWTHWLRAEWDLESPGGLALDTLLAFAAVDGRGPAFVEQMKTPAAQKVRSALEEWLRAQPQLGAAALVAWRAWETGRGRRALHLAVLAEALPASPWLRDKIRDLAGISGNGFDADGATVALAREAASALRLLERRISAVDVRALVREADDLVVDPELRALMSNSRRLPSAWQARLNALGQALREGVVRRAPTTSPAVTRAFRDLETHVFFKDAEEEARLKRAEMAVRLLCWLQSQSHTRIAADRTPYGSAVALGRWYAEEGGFVDRARHVARGSSDDDFGEGVNAVVDEADRTRDVLDRDFASSLMEWTHAGQPSSEVLPIHDVGKSIIARFLDGDDRRKLLVLLLDGMAWTQATELLESLGSRAAPWGPIAWHSSKENRIGAGHTPVVFAGLPTITHVSRSALFAGKGFGPTSKLNIDDRTHWAHHPALKKFAAAPDTLQLLLRGEGHTAAGGASEEALQLVAHETRRLVAIVLNAIDESLKGSASVRHGWGVANIASLGDLLEKARQHGRTVLLCSDHGHVPADRLKRSTPTGGLSADGGARWRALKDRTAPVAANEIVLSGPRVYVPPGADAIALVADDTTSFAQLHAGEHGGATLAEVVAPCVLIGCDDVRLDPTVNDAALDVRASFVPRWWHFEVSDADVDVEPEPPKMIVRPKSPKPALPDLFALPVTPDPEPVPAAPSNQKPTAPKASSPLLASEVLKARVRSASDRQEVADAVDVLNARQGIMAADAFAAALKILPFRVGGRISKLQEALNLDGYEVVRFDATTRQVRLDREKLRQLFEVSL